MHTPRLKVWKVRESNVKQEFARFVTDKKDEVFETDNVESKWNAMKGIEKAEGNRTSMWVDKRGHRGIVKHGGGMMRRGEKKVL